jgi:4-hydroxybenzoyl-CoA reductase subunit alpha
VRLAQTREEAFLTHRGRPETQIRIKLGLTRDGRMTACQADIVQRGGAYGGYGLVTILYAGALLNGIYDLPAVKYDGYRVYSNTPPCGAMRGHGTVNSRFAFESLLDTMAAELNIDPIEIRRRNLLRAPTDTINGLKVMSYGLGECLDWVEKASDWKQRHGKLGAGKGLGMACSHFVSGSAKPVHFTGQPHATIALRLDFDGAITILTGPPTSARVRRPSSARSSPRCWASITGACA